MRTSHGLGLMLIAALCMAACSKGHGKGHTKPIEVRQTVRFSDSHYACTGTESLDRAKSSGNGGQYDELKKMIGTGECKWLPTDKDFTVISVGKESKGSVVVGIVEDVTKVSQVFFTEYEYKD